MHIPFQFQDTPSFAEIAAEWSRLPGAPSEPEILTRLVSAMWRGEFERSGDQPGSMIFLFRKPEDRKEENGATVEYLDDDGVVTKTVWQRVEGVLDDVVLEDAVTADREAISLSRQDLLNALRWTGHSASYREAADAFTALAAQPLAFYKPLSRTHHIDVLRLRLADLAAWFEGSGLSWPRPAWLPLPIALPAVALPGSTLNELWPAPDAPKEGLKKTAPPDAPVAAPDAGSPAPQRDGDKQFTPPKPRRRGRPEGGAHDDAVMDELQRWPAGQDMNITRIADRTGATRRRVKLLLDRWIASQAERAAE